MSRTDAGPHRRVENFTFPYTINPSASDGTYKAVFTVVPQGTPNSESPDGSLNTSVSFTIDRTPPDAVVLDRTWGSFDADCTGLSMDATVVDGRSRP